MDEGTLKTPIHKCRLYWKKNKRAAGKERCYDGGRMRVGLEKNKKTAKKLGSLPTASFRSLILHVIQSTS
jgi:hypothetical protein